MFVQIECVFLAAITSRFHTVLQELHSRTACTFRFGPAEIVFALISCLTSKSFSNMDKFGFPLRTLWYFLNSIGNRTDRSSKFPFHRFRKKSHHLNYSFLVRTSWFVIVWRKWDPFFCLWSPCCFFSLMERLLLYLILSLNHLLTTSWIAFYFWYDF